MIVFAAFALLLSLAQLNLNSKSHNLSGAIITEKFYRTQMNVKEVIIESARQGAQEEFDAYVDPPNPRTLAACSNPKTQAQCFKEPEAIAYANAGALANIEKVLLASDFDEMHLVVLFPGTYPIEVTLKPSVLTPENPSGYELDTIKISKTSDMAFTLTSSRDSSLSKAIIVPNIVERYE